LKSLLTIIFTMNTSFRSLSLLLPLLVTSSLLSRPVDLSAPSGGLGPSSELGTARRWVEMTEIDFGQGLSLPLRMSFHTTHDVTSKEFGPGYWTTPLHESRISAAGPGERNVLLPCGKGMSLEPVAGQKNRWQTADAEWVATPKGANTLLAREDGWELEFNTKGMLIRLQNDAKRNILWTRDAQGKVLALAEFANGKQLPAAYRVQRHPNNAQITSLEVKTPNGLKQWTFGYNAGKELEKISFPDTSTVLCAYDATAGQPRISITGRDGITLPLSWNKDSLYLLSDGVWTYEVTAQKGNRPIMARTGPNGEKEIHHDDQLNHRSLFTAVDGTLTTTSKVSSGAAKGKVASITRLFKGEEKAVTVYLAEYDAKGLLASENDPLSRKTTHQYELHGATAHSGIKKHTLTNPLGHSSIKEYDNKGNLIASTDALGQTTRQEYDDQNRLVKMVGPDGQVIRLLTYTPAGQIASRTDAAGAATSYEGCVGQSGAR
jgi:YD repeat-containing protein